MNQIFIANLPFRATDEDLSKFLQQRSLVPTECRIVIDRDSQKSKGYGFAAFATEEERNRAISQLNGAAFQGRALVVREAHGK